LYLADAGDLFASYDVLKQVLKTYRGVVAIHAEDNECLEKAQREIKKPADAIEYLLSRPARCAAMAVEKALAILEATGGALHVCHVSTAAEVDLIRAAKKRGLDVTCEATPHHLCLTAAETKRLGSRAKVNPPLRTDADRDALWRGVGEGTIDIIATDHAPHTQKEKEAPFDRAPAGVPGLETMFPAVYTEGLRRGVSLRKLIERCTSKPAARFGIEGHGTLEAGIPADLTVIDCASKRRVEGTELRTKCGWSLFEGQELNGFPVLTLVGGKIVYNNCTDST
jgi:dihydroorotase (multifunctional complex type)